MVDWGVVCRLAAYCGPNSPLARAIGCHCLRRGTMSMPVSCHFRGCKAPLSRIVSGAIIKLASFTFMYFHNLTNVMKF